MPNALQRSALQRGLGGSDFASQVRNALRTTSRVMNEVADVNSDEMRAAGRVLVKSIRKELSKKNAVIGGKIAVKTKKRREFAPETTHALRRAPSAPGEPPAVQTGRLRRSVTMAPTDGALRVGTNRFTGRLAETGVDFAGRQALNAGDVHVGRGGKRSRAKKAFKARKPHHIAPRPFMERALEAAQAKMTDVFISTLQRGDA